MLINRHGKREKQVVGIALSDKDVFLGDNQYFEESASGKRINLIETKENGLAIKVSAWNSSSIYAYIKKRIDK